ncbi:MAG: protein-S-isoprenylcysteine O-methyltransferase Ste14 [Halieaceae bacterium]
MSTAPTDREQKKLGKMSKARHTHFILLVILICLASITFLVPEEVAPVMTVGVGVLICMVGISAFMLQYFRKCPRCKDRITRNQGACVGCGLEYYVVKQKNSGNG